MFLVLPRVVFTRHIEISKYFKAFFFLNRAMRHVFFIKRGNNCLHASKRTKNKEDYIGLV